MKRGKGGASIGKNPNCKNKIIRIIKKKYKNDKNYKNFDIF